MKSLAVIVSRGSTNNLVQVLTMLMAAVHSDVKVRVFFRDESMRRITSQAINVMDLSSAHAGDEKEMCQRLEKLDLADLHKLIRDIKASGDVKYFACSSSMAICGLKEKDLIPEIDEVRGLASFMLEDMAAADKVVTF